MLDYCFESERRQSDLTVGEDGKRHLALSGEGRREFKWAVSESLKYRNGGVLGRVWEVFDCSKNAESGKKA